MTFFLVSFLSRSHLSYWEIYTCHRNFIHWHLEWGSGAYLCDICPGDIFLIKFSRWHLSNWEFDTCHWKFFHWHLEFESGVYICDICSGDIFLIKFSRWHFVQVTFVQLWIWYMPLEIFPLTSWVWEWSLHMWHLFWWHFSDKIFQVTFCPGHICPFNNFSGWHFSQKKGKKSRVFLQWPLDIIFTQWVGF